jgi:hypothetical protein
MIAVRADDPRAAVVQDVGEVIGCQPEVDRHQDRPELRHGVERLELRMGIGRDIRHPISLADPQSLERG